MGTTIDQDKTDRIPELVADGFPVGSMASRARARSTQAAAFAFLSGFPAIADLLMFQSG
jgi:hypothetical protein